MSITPNRPEHADREYAIAGAHPRLTLRRLLTDYAYPVNGNLGNPTPHFTWLLLADGRVVDHASKKGALVMAARSHGSDYLAEIDSRPHGSEHLAVAALD